VAPPPAAAVARAVDRWTQARKKEESMLDDMSDTGNDAIYLGKEPNKTKHQSHPPSF
jgi:hypothetical protein